MHATVYYACGTGVSWDGSAIFYAASDCSGSPVTMASIGSSDELVIQAGAVVTVYGNQTTSAIKLTVFGTLFTKKGASPGKLTLSDNAATMTLEPGSVLGCSSDGINQSTCSPANSSQIIIGSGGSKYTYKGSDIDDTNSLPKPSVLDNTGGSLPVELLYFNAMEHGGQVEVTWATASEENFDYFSIERSADGIDFKEIGKLEGSGYSMSRIDYSFTDAFPTEGISYYRLRSIDFDGYTEVFETVIVQVEGLAKDFNIYPNPIANGSFRIQTNFVSTESATLVVYNNVGQIEDEFGIDSWLTTLELETSKKGLFLFKLFTSKGTIVKRVLVN